MAMEAELNEKLEQELIMMYSIIMNDGVKTKIPFESSNIIDKLQTNITLMLEKFKMMGSRITELEEENEKLEQESIMMYSIITNDSVKTEIPFDKLQTIKMMGSKIKELEEENDELKEKIEGLEWESGGLSEEVDRGDKIIGDKNQELYKLNEKIEELEAQNEANRIDVDNLSKLREAVRKELGCEPDPTQETIIKAIKKLKEENQ